MDITENGALTYNHLSDDLVNAWFKLGRNSSYPRTTSGALPALFLT